MPSRKRLQVLGAFGAFAALLALGIGSLRYGSALGVVVLAVASIAAVAALQAYWVRFDLPEPLGSRAVELADTTARRIVAITFDDGPGPDTLAILDSLAQARIRATFFVLGTAAREYPDLVREIALRGHVVGSHGDTHRKLHLALPGTIAREIDAGTEAIRAAGVTPVPLFRAPHGFKGPFLAAALRRRGMMLVGWSRGVWDSENPGVSEIVARACRSMRSGEILLLHDGNGTPVQSQRSREQTARAIPEIARRWKDAGYEFVALEPHALKARGRSLVLRRAQTRDSAAPRPLTGRAAQRRDAQPSSSGRVLNVIGLVVIGVLIILAVRHLDLREIGRALAAANPAFLIAAVVSNVFALAIQSCRWLAVVHPVTPRARPRDAFFALVAGYAIGLLIPARASDLARAHLMSRRSGGSMAALTITAIVDHLVGSIALLAVLALATTIWPVPGWVRSAGAFAAAVGIGGLLALWLLRPRRVRRSSVAQPSSAALPAAVPAAVPGKRISGMISRLRLGLAAVGSPRALGTALLFAFGGWTAEGLIAHFSLRGFGLPSGVAPSMMVVAATTLSAAASISPGNAGAFEVACIAALAGFGVTQEAALAFAIGYHAVHLIPTAVIGGGWLVGNGYRPTTLRGIT